MLRQCWNRLIQIQTCPSQTLLTRHLVQLAKRPWLPGSDGQNFPATLGQFQENYPFVHNVSGSGNDGDINKLGKEIRSELDQLIQKYAAVLIRGLPLQSSADFSRFFLSVGLDAMDYIGGAAARSQKATKVFTASDDVAEVSLEPHNEMSYTNNWPHLIFFFCLTAPKPGCGGESTMTDVRQLLPDIFPDVVEKFNRLGVRYSRRLFDRTTVKPDEHYGTWQAGTMSETRKQAEEKMAERCDGMRWEEDGSLLFWSRRPAMRPHYRTGEMLWFNQAHVLHSSFLQYHPLFAANYHKNKGRYAFETFYGDGSPIEDDVIQHIRDVTWRHTVGGQLKKSEILVLDNMLIQHGRMSFTSPRVLNVALAKYQDM